MSDVKHHLTGTTKRSHGRASEIIILNMLSYNSPQVEVIQIYILLNSEIRPLQLKIQDGEFMITLLQSQSGQLDYDYNHVILKFAIIIA